MSKCTLAAIVIASSTLISTMVLAENMTVRADSWCPYNCEPKSATPGVLIDMMQEVFGKDFTIAYEVMPWTQAVADVRTGQFNAVVGVAEADSAGLLHTQNPQMISVTCAYGLEKSKTVIKSGNDLRKLKSMGVAKDYSYGPAADKVLHDPKMKSKVQPMGGDEPLATNMRRVADGKIEALLEDDNVMTYQMKQKKVTNLKKLGCTEDRVPIWIGFTATNPKALEWVDKIARGQTALESSGNLAKIYDKYSIKQQ